ncbi:rifin [Plasmodium falciparum HB3]|uniref:Rifin n=2 Tax=Plasmodium falciparum TaxID=5833 RepID=A0A0L7KF59_PLAFX|nr:rifin [Plasmodium falciparum HB3]
MKIYYYNILLFYLPLNVLFISYHYENVNYTHHLIMIMTKKRNLCCNNLIIAHNNDYENMKKECKDQCHEEIQKIVLKDKIKKELTEKLAALYRDIFTEDIPTCICEKSLSGKVEKTCLKCGGILGGGLEPTVGLLVTVAVNQLTKTATVASIEFATQEGIKAGIKAVVHNLINVLHFFDVTRDIWLTLINSKNYNTVSGLTTSAKTTKEVGTTCLRNTPRLKPAYDAIFNKSKVWFGPAKQAGIVATSNKEASIQSVEFGKITTASTSYYTAIVASGVVIIFIVVVMVFIYLFNITLW